MRYSIKQYAVAFHDALEKAETKEERKEMIRRFMFLLRKHRASANLERIIAAFDKHYLTSRGLKKIEIQTPSGLDEKTRREISTLAGEKAMIDEIIQSELLAGIRIMIDNELLIDASGKKRLERLFTK